MNKRNNCDNCPLDQQAKDLLLRWQNKKKDRKKLKLVNPLIDLFVKKNIRVLGDLENPLFICVDVARLINDVKNYIRTTEKYDTRYKTTISIYPVFTEKGLYKYLLSSRRPEAEEFQDYVFDLLKKVRIKQMKCMATKLKIREETNLWSINPISFREFNNMIIDCMKIKYSYDPKDRADYEELKEFIRNDYNNKRFIEAYNRYNNAMKEDKYGMSDNNYINKSV